MKTKIFYFSTTGNSLALARGLKYGLSDAEMFPIPKFMTGNADVSAPVLGFVFPVYGWGLPRIVAEFVKGLSFKERPYVFAVATCGGTPGRALIELRGYLRKAGVDLNAGFVCVEGANTVTDTPDFVRFVRSLNRKVYLSGEERLSEILGVIRSREKHSPETASFKCNCFVGAMRAMMRFAKEKLKSSDSNFFVSEGCNSCRICERLCPRANICIEGGKPVWHHNCEMCNACIQWCPKQVIHTANESCRYHNPSVKVEDLLLR